MLVTNPYNFLGRKEAKEGKPMRQLDPNMTDTDYNEYKTGYITVKAMVDMNSFNYDHCFCNTLTCDSDVNLYKSIHNTPHSQ